MASFVSRTVLPSSTCVGSASGFFLRGDVGMSLPDTVLALSDALELLGTCDDAGGQDGGENDDGAINCGDKAGATTHRALPVVLFRRRVHGCVLAVSKLLVKVC